MVNWSIVTCIYQVFSMNYYVNIITYCKRISILDWTYIFYKFKSYLFLQEKDAGLLITEVFNQRMKIPDINEYDVHK